MATGLQRPRAMLGNMMMEDAIRQMIDSATRMSLETLRIQHQLQVNALSQQIKALEARLEVLRAG